MPLALLTQISFAAASSMGVVPMPPGMPNTAYVMNFNGPSLKCKEPNAGSIDIIDAVVKAVWKKVQETLRVFPFTQPSH
jgi:hypothetical protein